MIPVRHNGPPTVTRVFDDPLDPGHPLTYTLCPGCDFPLGNEAPVALVYVGPGPDPEDRQKAREGRWHTGAAVAVHALCAGADHPTEAPAQAPPAAEEATP